MLLILAFPVGSMRRNGQGVETMTTTVQVSVTGLYVIRAIDASALTPEVLQVTTATVDDCTHGNVKKMVWELEKVCVVKLLPLAIL